VGALGDLGLGTHEGCPYNCMETYASPGQMSPKLTDPR